MIHNSIWRIAQLPSVERAVRNNGGIADLVKRYIAGQDVDTAMQIARVLNSQGLDAVLAPVGTAQPMLHEIEHNLGTYFELIAAVAASSEVNEIAVAPALLGMTDGLASARPNVARWFALRQRLASPRPWTWAPKTTWTPPSSCLPNLWGCTPKPASRCRLGCGALRPIWRS